MNHSVGKWLSFPDLKNVGNHRRGDSVQVFHLEDHVTVKDGKQMSVAPVFAVSAFSMYQCSTRSCEQAPNNRQIAEEWFRADKGRTAVAVQSKTETIGEHR